MLFKILKYPVFFAIILFLFYHVSSPFVSFTDEIRHPFVSSENDKLCTAVVNITKKVGEQEFGSKLKECSVEFLTFVSEDDNGNLQDKSFKVAHLEAKPGGLDGFNAKQLANIQNLIKEAHNPYVVVFVHGWRNNSKVENGNLNAFRLMLGYSRQFVDQRKGASTKNSDVIGVYVGWHGAKIDEDDCKLIYQSIGCFVRVVNALLSFWGRKTQSDILGPPLIKALSEIKQAIHNKNSKMLVVGHSLGGNMLLTGMTDILTDKLAAHEKGSEFSLSFADQVVLINPASEARKWVQMQEEMHEKTGIKSDFSNYGSSDWLTMFNPRQKPVVMSITASCRWNNADTASFKKAEEISKRKEEDERTFTEKALRLVDVYVPCDESTGYIFPGAQTLSFNWLFNLFDGTALQQILAVGHYAPKYRKKGGSSKNPLASRLFGLSYQMVLNDTKKDRNKEVNETSWAGAAEEYRSECVRIDGALRKVQNAYGDGHGYWDSGSGHSSERVKAPAFPHSKDTQFNTQIRRGAYMAVEPPFIKNREGEDMKDETRNTVVPRYSPIWNIGALNAVVGHNTFVNYPTWCFINQFVLDDLTADVK